MDDYLSGVKECRFIRGLGQSLKVKDSSVVVAIGDDAAVLKGPGGKYQLLTVDMLVEGVHFRKGEDLKKVGYKAMAVSVSDIASMGGLPRLALVSVGFAQKNFEKESRRLLAGLKECADKFGISIIGGDTNRSEKTVVDVFLMGEVEPHRLALRSGGGKGDVLFVTGPLGGSQAGRHLHPEPRVSQARFLTERFKVHAMIDLSDGLAMDASRLAQASGTGALLFEDKIPVHKQARGLEQALLDGEDYELLFALSSKEAARLEKMSGVFAFIRVGVLTDEFKGVKIRRKNGVLAKLPRPTFSHFK